MLHVAGISLVHMSSAGADSSAGVDLNFGMGPYTWNQIMGVGRRLDWI